MRKSLKAQEVQIREHQIWKVQTLLDKVTRKLHLEWKVPFGGMNLWRYESFQDLWENHCFFYGLARRYRQLFWEDSASISTYLFMHWIYLFTMDGWRKLSTSILLEQTRRWFTTRAGARDHGSGKACKGRACPDERALFPSPGDCRWKMEMQDLRRGPHMERTKVWIFYFRAAYDRHAQCDLEERLRWIEVE